MLKDKIFEYRYSQLDKFNPTDFCTLALSNSIELKLGLGYFSSSSFNVLASGFARFISNGGRMSLYINQYLTEDDYNLLKSSEIDFDSRIINSFEHLKSTFSIRDEHFFRCLSYLIENNRIEIKIIVLKNGGLPHEKYGIFSDKENNKIYFVGSMNMTGSAIINNLETVECTCSWKGQDSYEKVNSLESHFYDVWNGKIKDVSVYDAKYFCQHIVKTYPNQDPENLLKKEEELNSKFSNKSIVENEPHFPSKFPNGPLPYQIEAYNAWVNNGKSGIFAMATGTGKTITSLNCALNEYQVDKYYNLIILVPTLDLVEQWKNEVSSFSFKKIIIVSSLNNNWRKELASLSYKLNKRNQNFVIISTYDSFTHSDFQNLLPSLSKNAILIADEAHNIGGKLVLKCFRNLTIKRRIALSATPKRIYDEEGTAEIEQFFLDNPPYTYSFSMKQAIEVNRLSRYFYYPKIAYLNDEEMESYNKISAELCRLFDDETGGYKNETLAQILLRERKQIIHKAADKLRVYKNILKEIGEAKLNYTFVYSPHGTFSNTLDEYDKRFINHLLDVTKEIYPNKRCNTFTGYDSKEMRTRLLSSFSEGTINVLFAMKCLDEGVDVPRAEVGIFTASSGNPREFIQRRGRLLRTHPDKQYATIYDIIVVPQSESYYISNIERNIVRAELERVAHFAQLSINNFSAGGAINYLEDVASKFGISISELINNLDN